MTRHSDTCRSNSSAFARLLHSICAVGLVVCAVGFTASSAAAGTLNGFDLTTSDIPVEEILKGGPPRDGIPALDAPDTLAAAGAPWPDDIVVIGVVRGDEARAYPIAILNWHELVNDTLGGEPILVSFCPLCGTGMVFDRRVAGKTRQFGVSGLLYLSDVLMYDRESESLWSQISAKAVTGPARGNRLKVLRSRQVLWGDWKKAHPKTTILSPATGHERNYARSPYEGYSTSDQVHPSVPRDDRYMSKMPTIGIRVPNGKARAYPASEIVKAGGRVEESFAGHAVKVAYDPERQVFDVEAPEALEVVEGYWFAWAAFHPDTSVFVAPKKR